MDTDPKILPNQEIPEATVDKDNIIDSTDKCSISQQLVEDSQDILNLNLENDQLSNVQNYKNYNLGTEELNVINQETDMIEEGSVVVSSDSADSSNGCGAGAIIIVTSDRLDGNVENTIVGDNEDVNTSTEIVKEAEKDKSEQSVSQTPSPTEEVEEPSIYCIKWVEYNQSKCGIITQSSNGPCPLIAIVNVLLLRGKLALPEGCQVISAEQLLEYLADLLISLSPDGQNSLPDFQHNMNDAITILPKLQTGLDVNVKFTGVRDFEYTPECIIFDLLNISLYHGWLVDPQLEDTELAVAGLSYNQLVETIITNSEAEDSTKLSQSLIAQQFLEESASQLTYHGLCELNTVMKENQLAVFFRNNHFSTVYKRGANLYLLVTDQGFLHQLDVVWETLENIEGDTVFVDHQLNPVQPHAGAGGGSPDQDHLLAMSLQKEDEAQHDKDREWQNFKEKHLGNTEGLTDSELAARLQEAENAAVEEERQEGEGEGGHGQAQAQGQAQGQAIGPRSNRDKKCVIL